MQLSAHRHPESLSVATMAPPAQRVVLPVAVSPIPQVAAPAPSAQTIAVEPMDDLLAGIVSGLCGRPLMPRLNQQQAAQHIATRYPGVWCNLETRGVGAVYHGIVDRSEVTCSATVRGDAGRVAEYSGPTWECVLAELERTPPPTRRTEEQERALERERLAFDMTVDNDHDGQS